MGQLTEIAFESKYNNSSSGPFYDQTAQEITTAVMRQFSLDIADSMKFKGTYDAITGMEVSASAHGFLPANCLTLDGSGAITKISAPATDIFIGIVFSVADVNTYTFAFPGSYVTGLSGLTAGTVYYAQSDGTIGTTNTGLAVFFADSTTTGYVIKHSDILPDIRFYKSEDWVDVAGPVTTHVSNWGAANSGTGSGVSIIGDTSVGENALGVLHINTGTTNSGYALAYTSLSALQTGYHRIKARFRVRPPALSDGTDTYTAYFGFGDNVVSGDMNDGCYFRYTHSVNSGKWEAVNAGGGSRTAVDSTVSASTTYKIFEIEINQAGSSVTFTIDGVSVSNTTDIPTGSSEVFGMIFKIEKSNGTNSSDLYMDWYDILITRTTAR